MSAEYVVKKVDGLRLAAYTATLETHSMAQHVGPLFDRGIDALAGINVHPTTPIATYEQSDGGMDVVVGFEHSGHAPEGMEIVDVPAGMAVCGVHLGPVERIGESWQALHSWLVENGHEFAGPCREFYVRSDSEDQQDWVTELQQPIVARG